MLKQSKAFAIALDRSFFVILSETKDLELVQDRLREESGIFRRRCTDPLQSLPGARFFGFASE
jgi:hypothetical protein